MQRKNIIIREDQEEQLKKLAYEQRRSEADIIREALDLYFKED